MKLIHADIVYSEDREHLAVRPDWLEQCTFPMEARYADIGFARLAYDAFVDDMIANGTMHACVYGTIHPEATSYLLESCLTPS